MMYAAYKEKEKKKKSSRNIRFPSSLAFTERSSFPTTTIEPIRSDLVAR